MQAHRKRFYFLGAALLLWVSAVAHAADLTGAGASFPYPVYARWAAQYHAETGHRVNYQSIGSGGGQQQIISGTVDFGATDDPMSVAELAKHDLIQFPTVIGGIVPVVNLPGIAPGELKLSGPVLADIFLGRITRWDDPAIEALNEGLALPKQAIVVVHRSDGSGTTFNWTDYLSLESEDWKNTVGRGKAVKWPTGQGGKGNEGMAAYVSQLTYSIGYLEYAYAHQNHMTWTRLQNREGEFVVPSPESFSAAARHADWASAPGMGLVLNDEPGADSWPMTAATFVLVPAHPDEPRRVREVLAFFDWAWRDADALTLELDYVPLPDELTDYIRTVWRDRIELGDIPAGSS